MMILDEPATALSHAERRALMIGRLDSAVKTQGEGIVFSVFAAAVIGGRSPGGGGGTSSASFRGAR